MKVLRGNNDTLRLACDDDEDTFLVQRTNQGEPFREGVLIGIENLEFQKELTVMLEDREAKKLRDFLNKMYP